jgi:predicted ester cyclase
MGDLIAQDDLVVERYTATGTQDGPFQGLPPSGRTATWTGTNIFRVECGRIVEIWSEVDALSRIQQLTGAALTA